MAAASSSKRAKPNVEPEVRERYLQALDVKKQERVGLGASVSRRKACVGDAGVVQEGTH